MNLGQHIFNYLQQNGRVELPGFGIFTVEKKSAHLDESSSVLLPPVQEIKFQRNTLVFNSDLSKYVAEATDENLFVIQTKMKEEVLFWHDLLEKNNNLTIEELGEFVSENGEIQLLSKNDFTQSPSYFGLEKIDLKEIEKPKSTEHSYEKEDSDNQYVFSKSILWTFLLIIPVGAILYLSINYKDKIFGKKSFNLSVKTSTHRIEKDTLNRKNSLNKDSVKVKTTDSIKISK